MGTTEDLLHEIEDNENGHFLVERTEGEARLRVMPAGRRGKPVQVSDVLARLDLFGLTEFDRSYVEEIVHAADGEAHAICSWAGPEPINATAEVDVAEDGMTAYLEIVPPRNGGAWITENQIRSALIDAKVVHGIDEALLASLVDQSFRDQDDEEHSQRVYTGLAKRNLRTVIARGDAPVHGHGGQILHRYDPNPRARPTEDHSGRVDFRKLNVIQTCQANEMLARLEPPRPGKPGWDVFGSEKPPPPSVAGELIAGENTVLSADGSEITSQIAGQILIETIGSSSARFDVREVLIVDKVDYSIGHIDFPGTVQVESTVLDGFEVKAGGDIIIEKTVGNVRLISGNDIILIGGAVSRGEGLIQADGNVFARFAQDASLFARESIFIEEASIHSRLVAGDSIHVENGRGEVMGGTIVCGLRLRTRKLGSRMETATTVHVGLDPEILERLRALDVEFEEKRRTLHKVETQLSQIDEALKRGRTLDAEEVGSRDKLVVIRDRYAAVLKNLDDQRVMLYAQLKPNPDAEVVALDAIYPGVEVHFGAGIKRYRVEGRPSYRYSRFSVDEGRIYLRHSDLA